MPLLTLSQLLGHSTIKMTTRYSHLASEDLRSAVSRLDSGRQDVPSTDNHTTPDGNAKLT